MSYTYDVESYDYAWLGLKQEDVKNLVNPLTNTDDWGQNNFHLHVLKKMRDPKYMHWTVKQLLNIDLLPEQVVIMQELWTKSFPMYIASRGFGKSFLLASLCYFTMSSRPRLKNRYRWCSVQTVQGYF